MCHHLHTKQFSFYFFLHFHFLSFPYLISLVYYISFYFLSFSVISPFFLQIITYNSSSLFPFMTKFSIFPSLTNFTYSSIFMYTKFFCKTSFQFKSPIYNTDTLCIKPLVNSCYNISF